MANYTDLFPNIYVDNAGNLQIDSDSVTISSNSLSVTPSSISTTQPVTLNSTLQLKDNILLKNQLTSSGATVPAGFVGIGFDRNQPFFQSPDFEGAKFIDARSTRIIDSDTQLNINDEFFLIGGTVGTPAIVTFPIDPFNNSRVYYTGGIGSYYAQLDSGNVDMVIYNITTKIEAFRGTTLDIDAGTNMRFTYNVISSDPVIVDQWSSGVQ